MLAGILSALCLWFSWRAYQRCRDIHASGVGALAADEPFERALAERELNTKLNLARRNVQAFGRVAIFGGAAMAFWGLASGELQKSPLLLGAPLGEGLLGWLGCRELRRRIGSLADSWRAATNLARRTR